MEAAAKLAYTFGVSQFVIGLTLVAIGTSLPELVTAITSSISGNGALSIGDVIGANITNLMLNLGLVAIFIVLQIKKESFRRDTFFLLFCSILFGIFAANKIFSRVEGIILLVLFLIYIAYLLRFEQKKGFLGYEKYTAILLHFIKPSSYVRIINHHYNKLKKRESDLTEDEIIFLNIMKHSFVIALSGFFVYFSAKYMVGSAINIASYFRVPEEIIGVLMVAIGTSSPELVVSIRSAKKGLQDILIGNVIGSCIVNLLLVAGVAMAIMPVAISTITQLYFIPFMIIATLLLIGFVRVHWVLKMFHGLIFVCIYILFIISLIVML